MKFSAIRSLSLSLIVPFLALFPFALSASSDSEQAIDDEFKRVTCRSNVKLAHKPSGHRLHSHSITYGSGSGQQSVTGFPGGDDPNSYWIVVEQFRDAECARGQPIKCDSIIRLKHAGTKKYLHSHLHASPLSGAQEVSAYEHTDTGDNWVIVCLKNTAYWNREAEIRLKHVDTSKFLSSSMKHQFRNPIPGQLEVAGVDKGTTDDQIWIVKEGLFFPDATYKDL